MAKKKDLTGKYIIAFDTLADGWQCATDEDGKPDPTLYDCQADAMFELFDDAVSMLENREPSDREEVGVTEEQFEEMKRIRETGEASNC